jgi:AraC-like DNA-binding protein
MRPIQTRTVFQNAPSSPLGRVSIAGTIFHSGGVPCDSMRVLGSYAVVFMLDGSGFYRDVNGVSLDVGAGDLILIFPDIAHCYGPYEYSHWTEIYLVFEGAVFDLWRQNGVICPSRPLLRLGAPEYWLRHLESVTQDSSHALRQICALQHVLSEALTHAETSSREHGWLRRACALLESNEYEYSQDSPLHFAARALNMSYESFRKKFTQLAGASPNAYRQARLMDKACELVYEGKSNKEVAAQLGFCDEFHFSRQFKRVTGFSPAELRRKLPRGEE